jgi:hypothetical protein
MTDDPLTIFIGAALAAAVFVGTLYGTIWFTRRRLARPLVATTLVALAAASPPWIFRSVGGHWSVEWGLIFSALIGTIVFAGGEFGTFRDLHRAGPSRDP